MFSIYEFLGCPNFLKLFQARLTYFGFENVIEWVCYVTAILFVIDLNECQQATGLRMEWQWMVSCILLWLKIPCLKFFL